MAFKQPRVPEYRDGAEAYLRTLILFLKDFCREAWTADRTRGREMEGLRGMVDNLRKALEDIRFPVASVNGKTGTVTLAASDVGALAVDEAAQNAAKLDGKTWTEMKLLLYPVGSIYLAANAESPASLFGGTWEQLQDRFLLGAGGAYAAGDTGGTAEETLSLEQIPSHAHGMHARTVYSGGGTYIGCCNESNASTSYASGSTGGGAAHNNMPPYLAVYMWRRVS